VTPNSANARSVKSPFRLGRLIRIAATALFTCFGVLFLILWLHNFWRSDVAWAPLPHSGNVVFASHRGQLTVTVDIPSSSIRRGQRLSVPQWGAQCYVVSGDEQRESLWPSAKAFRCRRVPFSGEIEMQAPYWSLIPLSLALAAAPWVRWSKRFSLRALLIAMTVIAVMVRIYATSGW
jgi:hypothetical protein